MIAAIRLIRIVFLPVMPIGVEQECSTSTPLLLDEVFLPVMPIGVEQGENIINPLHNIGRVLACDADRR